MLVEAWTTNLTREPQRNRKIGYWHQNDSSSGIDVATLVFNHGVWGLFSACMIGRLRFQQGREAERLSRLQLQSMQATCCENLQERETTNGYSGEKSAPMKKSSRPLFFWNLFESIRVYLNLFYESGFFLSQSEKDNFCNILFLLSRLFHFSVGTTKQLPKRGGWTDIYPYTKKKK